MAKKVSDFNVITKGFIQYLEKTGQLEKLPALAKEQVQLSRTRFDTNIALVTSAVALDDTQLHNLKARLKSMFQRPITIRPKVDSHILGGMIIRLGDQIVDLSLKSRLKELEEQLTIDS